MSLVVDTHSFIWFLARSSDLSSVAGYSRGNYIGSPGLCVISNNCRGYILDGEKSIAPTEFD